MTEPKVIYKRSNADAVTSTVEIELPPIQEATLPETLSKEVADLFHFIPYDYSTIAFLEYINTLENPHLLSKESYQKILQRVKFYRKSLPSSFFNRMEGILTKVLRYDEEALNEFNKLKNERL